MSGSLKHLFVKDEVNTSRQFEFDFAKAVCILGMVFVHCFEELAWQVDSESSSAYYIVVIVLDAIFGAGTFMASMGLGIAYSTKSTPDKIMKRGLGIFIIAYVLNIVRFGIPSVILYFNGFIDFLDIFDYALCDDILMFAGLAMMLLGFLKKIKLPDLGIFLVSLVMSVTGSFVRFIHFDNFFATNLAGLFVGTYTSVEDDSLAPFPLLNWFIIVVLGYLLGKLLRHCSDKEKYFAVSFPVSAVFLTVYMVIAIPNKLGMMNENILYYYHMTTLDVFVLLMGTVFVTGLYHYISKLFSDKVIKVITTMSSNINSVYCIHWVIIGWTVLVFAFTGSEGLNQKGVLIYGIALYIVANILAEFYQKFKKKRKAKVNK